MRLRMKAHGSHAYRLLVARSYSSNYRYLRGLKNLLTMGTAVSTEYRQGREPDPGSGRELPEGVSPWNPHKQPQPTCCRAIRAGCSSSIHLTQARADVFQLLLRM